MGGENAAAGNGQNERYARVASAFGSALARLARAYEADPDQRQDLLQEIHLALWRSFAAFDGRCSERTWLYRVAHNVATSHLLGRRRRGAAKLLTLDELASHHDPQQPNPEAQVAERDAAARLMALVQTLAPADRQMVLLYLEGLEAAAIGEVCGRSAGAVATQLHRLKGVLAHRFSKGGPR